MFPLLIFLPLSCFCFFFNLLFSFISPGLPPFTPFFLSLSLFPPVDLPASGLLPFFHHHSFISIHCFSYFFQLPGYLTWEAVWFIAFVFVWFVPPSCNLFCVRLIKEKMNGLLGSEFALVLRDSLTSTSRRRFPRSSAPPISPDSSSAMPMSPVSPIPRLEEPLTATALSLRLQLEARESVPRIPTSPTSPVDRLGMETGALRAMSLSSPPRAAESNPNFAVSVSSPALSSSSSSSTTSTSSASCAPHSLPPLHFSNHNQLQLQQLQQLQLGQGDPPRYHLHQQQQQQAVFTSPTQSSIQIQPLDVLASVSANAEQHHQQPKLQPQPPSKAPQQMQQQHEQQQRSSCIYSNTLPQVTNSAGAVSTASASTMSTITTSTSLTAATTQMSPRSTTRKRLGAFVGKGQSHGGAGGGVSKTFRCSLCSSTFSQQFNLNKHVRAVHERRRPFQCNVCHARFQQKSHRTMHHLAVHEKLRQFACDHCSASFSWRGVLKKHKKSIHGIDEWECGTLFYFVYFLFFFNSVVILYFLFSWL